MAATLDEVLTEARRRGFLGEQPISGHIAHAAGFAAVCRSLLPDPEVGDLLIDLGSGGGVPGLPLVTVADAGFPRVVLLEGSCRRADWLSEAVALLEVQSRTEVLAMRAELAGRLASWRSSAAVVVARSCGAPAVTAELAAPLIRPGGYLIVSEPPGIVSGTSGPGEVTEPRVTGPEVAGPEVAGREVAETAARVVARSRGVTAQALGRWPEAGVAQLGFAAPEEWSAGGFRFVALAVDGVCPARYPRRTGVPAKHPLFSGAT